MRIERRFTELENRLTTPSPSGKASEIRNPDGSVVFHLESFTVPEHWSQVAADILAQKYFRKAGVPAAAKKVEEETVPSWLWRSVPDQRALESLPENERFIGETDARQVFDRLAGTWTYWGWKAGYFTTEDDASAFFDELRYMLAIQMGAPNSPQWFNTGLHWAYGIDARAKATTTRITPPARSRRQRLPTSTRSRMPASSSRSTTTSSTKAGSWTSGCARRACSSMAPAPARTSQTPAARTSRCQAAANPRA